MIIYKIIYKFFNLFDEHYQWYLNQKKSAKLSNLKNKLFFCGKDVYFNGDITITSPKKTIIGNNVHIGNNAYFHTNGNLYIGDNTHISRNVTIYTANHNYESGLIPYNNEEQYKQVTISRNVWIGMNVCIVPGVTIGEGAIIGLGCVVTSDVPELAVVGIAPHRILKNRNKKMYYEAHNNKSFGGINGKPIQLERIKEYPQTPNFD